MTQEELNKELIYACSIKDWDKVKELIEKGADVNARDALGWTVLHAAVWYKNLEMVKFLLAKGADVKAKNEKGETALDIAITLCQKINISTLLYIMLLLQDI